MANRYFTRNQWKVLNELYAVAESCGATIFRPVQGVYIVSSLPNYTKTPRSSRIPDNAAEFMSIFANGQYSIHAGVNIYNSMIDNRPCLSLDFTDRLEYRNLLEYDFYTQIMKNIHPMIKNTIEQIDLDKFAELLKYTIHRVRLMEQKVDCESVTKSQEVLGSLINPNADTDDEWPRVSQSIDKYTY